MLTLQINHILAARGIERPFNFLVKAGFSRTVASTILSGSVRNLKLDLIEKLCLVLYCTPHDILWWKPEKNAIVPADHPIYILKKQKQDYNWKESLKTLPLDQIDLLASRLKQQGPHPSD